MVHNVLNCRSFLLFGNTVNKRSLSRVAGRGCLNVRSLLTVENTKHMHISVG